MSSLTAVFNSALSSLYASQMGIAVASNNISNAQNPEYTRQRLITAPAPSYGGNINIGYGVDVISVESLRDKLIETRRLQENSSLSGSEFKNRTLADIEVQFTDTESTGLLNTISNFFNSFQMLSTDPASPNFRQQVRISADALMMNFKALRDGLVNANRLTNRAITDQVGQINSLARQIAGISGEIASQEASGAQASELRDQRSQLVMQLSSLVDVHEFEADDLDRTYQLTIGDNRAFIFGTHTFSLSAVPDVNGNIRVMSGGVDITDGLNDGEIVAAIDVRDNYIPKYINSLDQLAYEITQQVNARHSVGYDLNGNTGIDFFQALASATGAAGAMALSSAVAGNVSQIAASSQPTGQDNDIAMQIGSLLFQPVFTGGSASDQYRSLVFEVGTDVATAEVSVREHDALMQQLQMRRQEMSGVSIDEETVSILQFQRAYQASARLMRTIDELTETLLNI